MEKTSQLWENGTFQLNTVRLLLFSSCFIWVFKRRLLYQFSNRVWKICFPSRFFMSFAFSSPFLFFPLWKNEIPNLIFDVWVGTWKECNIFSNHPYFFLLRKVQGNLFWQVEGYQIPFWHFHWQKENLLFVRW